MAKRNGVKHTAVYGAFRKSLEALGDWLRPVAVPHLPEVGSNVCPECMVTDARLTYRSLMPFAHNIGSANCRKSTVAA